jgi:hypothetical protein
MDVVVANWLAASSATGLVAQTATHLTRWFAQVSCCLVGIPPLDLW